MAAKPMKNAKKPAKKTAVKKTAPAKKTQKGGSKTLSRPGTAKKAAIPRGAVTQASLLAAVSKIRSASRPKNSSTNSYTQSEFIENVKAFCGLAKRSQAKEILEDFAAFIKDSLKKGYKVPFLGLGKMYVRHTKPREGRNPATGETIRISAKKRVRFAPAKALKEAVL